VRRGTTGSSLIARTDCSYPCGCAVPAWGSRGDNALLLFVRDGVTAARERSAALLAVGGPVRRLTHGSGEVQARCVPTSRGGVMPEQLLEAAGRRRSPATLPEFHAGRPPRNKGMRYPRRSAHDRGDRCRHAPRRRRRPRSPAAWPDRRTVARACAFTRRSRQSVVPRSPSSSRGELRAMPESIARLGCAPCRAAGMEWAGAVACRRASEIEESRSRDSALRPMPPGHDGRVDRSNRG
jgi:hypothetical protein